MAETIFEDLLGPAEAPSPLRLPPPNLSLVEMFVTLYAKGLLSEERARAVVDDLYEYYMAPRRR